MTKPAFKKARQGQLPIGELFQTAQDLSGSGQQQQAIDLYRTWLRHAPAAPLAYAAQFNLAVLLSDSGDTGGAEACYRKALEQNPRFCEALLNLGTLLERLTRPDEALSAWRRVLDVAQPAVGAARGHHLQALNNLGRLLQIQKDFPGAEAMLTRSLHLDPEQPNVITHWVHLRQKQCKWPVYSTADSGIPEHELMSSTAALAMLSGSGDPAWQLAASRRFITDKVITDVAPLSDPAGYNHQRLRVGYLSSDFCSHAVSILTAELYGLHDRSRIEVFGYDWSNDDGSPLRARVLAGMDHHLRIHSLSDEEAAKLIRSHEIDILVDLHGLTLGARPNILSYRPAPVQMTWLGLPGPTGHPAIDYVIADPYVLPPELEAYFTEKPLHMPRTFQINDRQRQIGPRPTRAACKLPEQAMVYCAFNNAFKFNPEVFACWMRILQRVPGSVLWLTGDNPQVRDNLAREALAAGVDPARLLFADRVLPADYLARYQVADLFLDTSPFNGGTTASDALWAGLPVLTCSGRTFSSRMAGSLLLAVDLPQLVTHDWQAYEDQAVALGLDRQPLAQMKQQLEQQRMSCALFDSPQFVRDLEDRYFQVARRNTGLPLVSILMPTSNRPELAEQALLSALAQTYPNLDIVVSDNSDDDLTQQRLAPYVLRHPQLRYVRVRPCEAVDNVQHCYSLARGDYINFLMDDELLHPDKIALMAAHLANDASIGLVTSARQLVDADGEPVAAPAELVRPFAVSTRVSGASLGNHVMHGADNIVGGPSTVLFRKAAAGPQFGLFFGHQYHAMPYMTTWLKILMGYDCVYLAQPLSSYRLRGEADAAARRAHIRGHFERAQMFVDACEHRCFVEPGPQRQALLKAQLVTLTNLLNNARQDIVDGAYEPLQVASLMQQTTALLLEP